MLLWLKERVKCVFELQKRRSSDAVCPSSSELLANRAAAREFAAALERLQIPQWRAVCAGGAIWIGDIGNGG